MSSTQVNKFHTDYDSKLVIKQLVTNEIIMNENVKLLDRWAGEKNVPDRQLEFLN